MQVFIPYKEPLEVAKCLDQKRLRKQIIENKQILTAIAGEGRGWMSHPVVKMYAHYSEWLMCYNKVLTYYAAGDVVNAIKWNDTANQCRPQFITDELCKQHRRRLYTKAPSHYPQFASYGMSDENWYVVNGKTLKYIEGKLISNE